MCNTVLRLNVGGTPFCMSEETVRRFPDSKLARFLDLTHDQRVLHCDAFFNASQEYFFDRSALLFEIIVQTYRRGSLTSSVQFCCQDALETELLYWELKVAPDSHVCKSCGDGEMDNKTIASTEDHEAPVDEVVPDEKYTFKCCIPCRRLLWTLLEDPFSSRFALVYATFTIFFVLLTIAVLMVDSLPEFRLNQCTRIVNLTDRPGAQLKMTCGMSVLDILDVVCVVWFTMDFVLRFIATPQILMFVRNPMNIIDLCALIPFYVELAIDVAGTTDSSGTSTNIRRALMALRAFRIGRVVQLARYSDGLQALALALRRSIKELMLMFMFLAILVTFLATIVFYLESDVVGSDFTSIPAAAWWGLITVTTIGYGDMVPKTIAGKVVGACAALLGIVVLAFPVSVIVDNCRKAYDEMIARKRRREARNWKTVLKGKKVSATNVTT